ncbi:MAG TPA: dipeptide ABC transporter ATP-binding protein [Polyangiaceae bacterium LLY-WYZ-15_(1-7)]|nr:dipeptide ABC transporter ATP-binding protein [Polyangiaceae bacterium LLY-WYZ-15_(1-7)]HJL04761.1 dipeptide ABC transporter ATP-binding protein [Polyangiaceae bacterium LLY-WYZ-15_(1-7)]HJL12010.1 dipeptide ABC transporter ATP-binding protein [Polyangiaceae bacterium LLY-WYZ-15_(1-7)]HJL23513.1 dipeptide ABC transporter ATP-binding protein [Polyangiaceae bacterium LLY-WYZ-15_(1-7)]HJL30671.1 dipeptide ABC transporter ATP-binding protein [Polyangiaceae bacterium LLY-WYZ-15_(1-7)]
MTDAPELLEIRGLETYFHTDEGTTKAVDGIDLTVHAGRTLGLVGESGSGKSVTSLTVMRLLPELVARIEGGSISFLGQDLVRLPPKEMRKLRGDDIAMIFQEPGTSLNPVHRVGDQVMEAIRLHLGLSKEDAVARTLRLFEEVGIPDPERRMRSYPHEMSGGQKQRVMIAMALSCDPKLLIADEPTTALDVTIQMQILDLIRKLRDERQMGILFITHDLGVIAEIADEVAVMYRGHLMETGPVERIFTDPQHPYTKGLLACRPRLETRWRRLPTVSDYMEVRETEDGGRELVEKAVEDESVFDRGRGRMLHPPSKLEALGGYAAPDEGDATALPEDAEPLLSVQDLKVWFPIRKGLLRRVVDHVKAVDGVSFDVYPGQTLGLVGESGCGKTTTGRAILRLQEKTAGRILFEGKDVHALSGEALRAWRRRVQIVFQDPYGSLNPRMRVVAMLTEAMKIHGLGGDEKGRVERAGDLLEEVGLGREHLGRYPHEFSGGQRQRIGIARALAVEPELIVCDESVSALDVSVQAQVLNLLKDLQEERGLTYIFISHDLSVVKFMSDMMAVMNDGKIVEQGPSDAIYEAPREAYTKRLIAAIPDDSIANIRRRQADREAAAAKQTDAA